MCIIRVKSRHRFGHGAILSPLARTDCWGVRFATRRKYRASAARSRVAIVEHHTAARSAGATMLPDARGGSAHPTCCVLNVYDAWWGTIVRRWDRHPPRIQVANSALVAYSDPEGQTARPGNQAVSRKESRPAQLRLCVAPKT